MKEKEESRTWRLHWNKWHWRLTWLAKEKEQGTRQCNLINIPRIAVLYFPLLFLVFPSLHREGFSTQQCKLQCFQSEIYAGESQKSMQNNMGVEEHSVESTIWNDCHLRSDRKEKERLPTWGERPNAEQHCCSSDKVKSLGTNFVFPRLHLGFCSITFTQTFWLRTLANFLNISTILVSAFLVMSPVPTFEAWKNNWISDNGIAMCTAALCSVVL